MGLLVGAVAALVLSVTERGQRPAGSIRVQAAVVAAPEPARQTGARSAQCGALVRAVRTVLVRAVTHPARRDTGAVHTPGEGQTGSHTQLGDTGAVHTPGEGQTGYHTQLGGGIQVPSIHLGTAQGKSDVSEEASHCQVAKPRSMPNPVS